MKRAPSVAPGGRDRPSLRLLLPACALVLGAVALWAARPEAAVDLLDGDSEERALLATLDKEKLIRARELADKILRRKPRSIIARYALAQVFHQEEGNLPRALYHLRRLDAQLIRLYGNSPERPKARSWHRKILIRLEAVLGEMDRREEQLAVLDRHDAHYEPKLERLKIWPLMKLHRFDEARKIAEKATLSDRLNTRIAGYNGLLSIEFEREKPLDCFRVAMRAVNATAERSCILDLNTAEAAFAVFRFSEAERLALKSIQAPIKDCPSSAHPHLANLYLLRGDFQRAIAAVKQARKQGVPRRLRQQFEMGLNAWLMRLLYTLGRFEKSVELGKRVLRRPDRVGMISYSKELMETIYTIDHYAALTAWGERLREQASARPALEALGLWAKAQKLSLEAWAVRRKVARLLGQERTLRSLLRPYLKPLPSWRLLTLARIAGAGVTRRALAALRARDEMKSQVEPYLLAIEASLSRREGDRRATLALARKSLAALPKDERLLRGHVQALAAEAALALGDGKAARHYFHRVVHRWPTALRIHGVRLPARIEATKGELAGAVARKLRSSRRLLTAADKQLGFKVLVEQRGQDVRICLNGPQGRRYACSVTEGVKTLKKLPDDAARVAQVIDDFHQKAFAPLIDLTQQDINSLDGSAVRGSADQLLEDVLGKDK
jgi:tetratricopeptide (TPR) repeat protein